MLLKSNEYWGKRSGAIAKDGTLALVQQQWGTGVSRDGKNYPRRFRWPLPFRAYGAVTQKLLAARKRAEEQLRREI